MICKLFILGQIALLLSTLKGRDCMFCAVLPFVSYRESFIWYSNTEQLSTEFYSGDPCVFSNREASNYSR